MTLTKEQKAKLQGIASSLWHGEMGMEIMGALAECGESTTIPRSHVLELVLDAGRFEEEVARRLPECLAEVQAMNYTQLKNLVRPAFPYASYGN